MKQSIEFRLTDALITERIERLRGEIAALEAERAGLLPRHKRNGVASTPSGREALTCAEAIDAVLVKAKKPLKSAAILAGFSQLDRPVRGNPAITSIRSVMHRRAATMGWKKHGSGRSVRWTKGKS